LDLLSRIAGWLGENEATISAVVGIMVLAGALFAGVRSLLRRRGEAAAGKARAASPEAASADSSPADLDPLTVPGFEGRPAIAVLAFDNLSGDPDQEYFADGIAEDLITRLSVWRDFPVIARNSSFTYKGKAVDVKQVSRELGARYVVEGSVRRSADRVRISAQLIDATTGGHVWAENYDRELRDIFAVQDEITEEIVRAMGPALWKSETGRAIRAENRSLGVYDCKMRGLWHLGKFSEDDNVKARALFERVIELDPANPQAFSYLAYTHFEDILFSWTDSPAQSLDEQFRAARAAVRLDSTLADGQISLAWAYSLSGEREQAIAAARLAVQLNPSQSGAHLVLGYSLAVSRDPEEGIRHLERAVRLSPQDLAKNYFLNCIAIGHFTAGRYAEAVEWEQQSLQWNPDYWVAHAVLASSYAHLGKLPEAQRAFREMVRLNPEFSLGAFKMLFSIADTSFIEGMIDGLRKAGLPE
jgi:adenylate cyclase